MHVIDVTKEVDDGKPIERNWRRHRGITVHRGGINRQSGIVLGTNAIDICAHFSGQADRYPEVAKATGGHIPYSLIIGDCGSKWQTLPLGDVGHHARVWSSRTIGAVSC